MRPKYIVRRRKEVLGLWYNGTKESCFIGGPKTHFELGEEVSAVILRLAKGIDTMPPLTTWPGYRWRRQFPMTLQNFYTLVRWLNTMGPAELDATIKRAKTLRRLVY